jgi:hypothetical protein
MLLSAPCNAIALSEAIKELKSLAFNSVGAAIAREQSKERAPAHDEGRRRMMR